MSKELIHKNQEELNILLDAATPTQLAKTIQTLLFAYVLQQAKDGIHDDFAEHIDRCQLLICFFDELPS